MGPAGFRHAARDGTFQFPLSAWVKQMGVRSVASNRQPQQRQLRAELRQEAVEAPLRRPIGSPDGLRLPVGPDDEVDGAFAEMQTIAG